MKLANELRKAIEAEFSVGSQSFAPKKLSSGFTSVIRDTQTHSTRLLYGAAVMTIAVFVVMIVIVVANRGDPASLTGISAIFGTSIVGLIVMMIRISRSITQAGLLLAIVLNLPSEDALNALKAILAADGKFQAALPKMKNA